MSSASNKIIQAAAGNAAGGGTYVEEVFSTYLYDGTGSAQTITNGIDLDGEGGLVWQKSRSSTGGNALFDTERGSDFLLESQSTAAQVDTGTGGAPGNNDLTSFNANGFSMGTPYWTNVNNNGSETVSWTFRKAPKFFDVVTYTGDGVQGRRVNHNLGCEPSMIITKCTSHSESWNVSVGSGNGTADQIKLQLNNTGFSTTAYSYWGGVAGDATAEFALYRGTGTFSEANVSGREYVAYLFAHNDDDGEFGEDADQDIIKGGSYTEAASGVQEIDVGFEPQWLLVKSTSLAADWYIYDVMRGQSYGGSNKLEANTSDVEASQAGYFAPTPNGFIARLSSSGYFGSGEDVIYIAIRRGPMKTPEDADDVFDLHTSSPSVITTGFPVDAILAKYATSNWDFVPRLTEGSLATSTSSTEVDYSAYLSFASNTAFLNSGAFNSSAANWCFRRGPGFFDVVAYEGNGTAGHTVSHNLGVVPEIIIVKRRNASFNWFVYASGVGNTAALSLNQTISASTSTTYWNDTDPTESNFSLGTFSQVNGAGGQYIAYLFATLDGISKVGSYTGNGTSQTIDCGFSAGARFVLTKRTNTTGNWNVWDSERGIVAGNDPRLELNTTDAEDTGHDYIDPDNSGFIVNYVADDNDDSNVSDDEYIFLAIA